MLNIVDKCRLGFIFNGLGTSKHIIDPDRHCGCGVFGH